MTRQITVSASKKDAALIERALRLPDIRAFVLIVGALMPFDAYDAERILRFAVSNRKLATAEPLGVSPPRLASTEHGVVGSALAERGAGRDRHAAEG